VNPVTAEPLSQDDAFTELFDRAVKAVLRTTTVPPDDMSLDDAGLESFNLLNLMMILEDEIGILLPLEQIMISDRVHCIGDLRAACRDAIAGQGQ